MALERRRRNKRRRNAPRDDDAPPLSRVTTTVPDADDQDDQSVPVRRSFGPQTQPDPRVARPVAPDAQAAQRPPSARPDTTASGLPVRDPGTTFPAGPAPEAGASQTTGPSWFDDDVVAPRIVGNPPAPDTRPTGTSIPPALPDEDVPDFLK